MRFNNWLEELEGDLDRMGHEFQMYYIPPIITVPPGMEFNGKTSIAPVQYSVKFIGEFAKGHRPQGVRLTRLHTPTAKDTEAPEEFYVSWSQFQDIYGRIFGRMKGASSDETPQF